MCFYFQHITSSLHVHQFDWLYSIISSRKFSQNTSEAVLTFDSIYAAEIWGTVKLPVSLVSKQCEFWQGVTEILICLFSLANDWLMQNSDFVLKNEAFCKCFQVNKNRVSFHARYVTHNTVELCYIELKVEKGNTLLHGYLIWSIYILKVSLNIALKPFNSCFSSTCFNFFLIL